MTLALLQRPLVVGPGCLQRHAAGRESVHGPLCRYDGLNQVQTTPAPIPGPVLAQQAAQVPCHPLCLLRRRACLAARGRSLAQNALLLAVKVPAVRFPAGERAAAVCLSWLSTRVSLCPRPWQRASHLTSEPPLAAAPPQHTLVVRAGFGCTRRARPMPRCTQTPPSPPAAPAAGPPPADPPAPRSAACITGSLQRLRTKDGQAFPRRHAATPSAWPRTGVGLRGSRRGGRPRRCGCRSAQAPPLASAGMRRHQRSLRARARS